MKIYVAAKYARRFELRPFVAAFQALGHECTAQWIDNAEESKGKAEAAQMDIDDVHRADALIFFSEPKGSANTGGGRYFELGYAHACGKTIMVVLADDHETVFTALPTLSLFPDKEQLLQLLARL